MDGLLCDMYGQPSMQVHVNDSLFGGGKGFRMQDATLSTLGEAIERAAGAFAACSSALSLN